jgi:HPt (histidine-containing phosphotransfer) domain-containing protein
MEDEFINRTLLKEMSVEKIKLHLAEQFHLPVAQVEELLPNFISALASHMEHLQVAVQSGDLEVVSKAGHMIKGAFLNLGLKECAAIAQTIEEKGKAGETATDYLELVEELRVQTESLFTN